MQMRKKKSPVKLFDFCRKEFFIDLAPIEARQYIKIKTIKWIEYLLPETCVSSSSSFALLLVAAMFCLLDFYIYSRQVISRASKQKLILTTSFGLPTKFSFFVD